MATKPLPDDLLHQSADAYRRHGILGHRELGLARSTFDSRVSMAVSRGFLCRSERKSLQADGPFVAPAPAAAPIAVAAATVSEADILRDQVRTLKAQIATAAKGTLTDELVRREIIKLGDARIEPPSWLLAPKEVSGVTGVPILFASDWHWGEMVFPAQINGVNEYNLAIAQRRAHRMVETAVTLLKDHMVNPNYPGIVFALGGDMMSGDIHEELSESNEIPVMPALLDLFGVLTWAIRVLADEFGQVFIPCVTGNHGRNTHKPRAKNRNYSNFDWLLYQFLEKQFEGDERVSFLIPDGSDAHFKVYGHRYCLTHGDQFRGGDGMIGALGPIIRGDHKKRSRNGQIDLPYDTLMLGHWHQLIQLQRLIVNGSLKGYDEYAASGNFGFEPPQQACWITHPQQGITFSMPIHCEPREAKVARSWVSWPKG